MVRLILTLTPVLCMLGGIAMSVTFDHYLKPDEITTAAREPKPVKAKGKTGMSIPGDCIDKLLYGQNGPKWL